jgi:hypothetical protein
VVILTSSCQLICILGEISCCTSTGHWSLADMAVGDVVL